MLGISKPPVIISKAKKREFSRNNIGSIVTNDFSPSRFTNGAFATNKSKELSCFKTMSAITPFRSVSIFQTASRIGLSTFSNEQTDSYNIELTEGQEKILSTLFEQFSHIDEATKKRVIKAQFIVEIFTKMVLPMQIDRKDIDIAAQRIKYNMNSHLTFEQFAAVI
jgi:hypothetical protein